MCFRPATISLNKCEKCGKQNKPIAKVCEQCGEPLEQVKVDMDADAGKLNAMNTFVPGAPSAPAAPKSPTAPKPSGE